jgi:hypothetical protein
VSPLVNKFLQILEAVFSTPPKRNIRDIQRTENLFANAQQRAGFFGS